MVNNSVSGAWVAYRKFMCLSLCFHLYVSEVFTQVLAICCPHDDVAVLVVDTFEKIHVTRFASSVRIKFGSNWVCLEILAIIARLFLP